MSIGLVGAFVVAVLTLQAATPAMALRLTAMSSGVAVNPATNRLYVPRKRDRVAVIDGRSDTVVKELTVGRTALNAAVNPLTNRIYVTNWGDATLSVIDGTTDTVAATLKLGGKPNGVAVNPATNRIYVANTNEHQSQHYFFVIDGATDSVIARVPTVAPNRVIAVNPETNRIFLPDGLGNLLVFSGDDHRLLATIPGVGGAGLDVHVPSNTVWVAGGGLVTVVDGATYVVVARLPGGDLPYGVAVDGGSNRVYVTDIGKNVLRVFDAATYGELDRLATGFSPQGLAVNPETHKTYVLNVGSDTISVIYQNELLRNPSFDADRTGDGLPDRWRGANLEAGDGVTATSVIDGRWVFRFGATSQVKRLWQAVRVTGGAGERLRLSAFSRLAPATAPAAAAAIYRVVLTVRYTDGTEASAEIPFAGQGGWRKESVGLKTAQPYDRLRVTLEYAGAADVLFDALHLERRGP